MTRAKLVTSITFRAGDVEFTVGVQWNRRRHAPWDITIEVSDPRAWDENGEPMAVMCVAASTEAHDIEDAKRIACVEVARFAADFRMGFEGARWSE